MQAVNLLPKQAVVAPGRNLGPLALAGAAAVPVIAIVLVVVGYSTASSSVAAEKTSFAALQAQIAALGGATAAHPKTATDTATAAQWNALIAERTARRTELDAVLGQELPWDSMLRSVARILPSDVWLTALNIQSPVTFGAAAATSGAPGVAATNITLTGDGESEKSIALLLVRLRLLPILSNISLGPTSSTPIGAKSVIQFTVTASIQVPAGAILPTSTPPVPATTTTPAG
jgi:Tfp pilus assembly protein PilN